MSGFIKGVNRSQSTLFPESLDDFVNAENTVRVIDGWADSNKDCQNSRMETLIAYSLSPVQFKTGKECKVVSGKGFLHFQGRRFMWHQR